MKETMTIHKALAELKIIDSRVGAAIENLDVVCANKHSNAKIQGLSIADYSNEAKRAYQSVRTLINRRDAIKRAVTRSNAITMVEVGGKQYSVAEAIDMKSKGVAYICQLKNKLENQYSRAKLIADRENGERLDSRADDYIKSLYQGADLKNMAKEIDDARKTFITAQTVEIIDPVGAGLEAERLQDFIDTFMADVDSALSVSNALTTIEVEYETK